GFIKDIAIEPGCPETRAVHPHDARLCAHREMLRIIQSKAHFDKIVHTQGMLSWQAQSEARPRHILDGHEALCAPVHPLTTGLGIVAGQMRVLSIECSRL